MIHTHQQNRPNNRPVSLRIPTSHMCAKPAASAHRTRIPKFLLAGLANTAFGYAVFALLVWVGLHPQLALIGQFGVGILWNRAIHRQFVYGPAQHARLVPYAAAYGLVYLFNAALLWGLIHIGLGPYLAQALALIPSVALSYVLVSRVFSTSPLHSEDAP